MSEIYQYTDYRAYLRDYFAEHKAANQHFSHQSFARRAQIKSSGFLLHVMKGERNLTRPVMLKIARAIGLNVSETEYFENLVSFDQARSMSDKNFYFSKIAGKRQQIHVKSMDDTQYEYFDKWHHSVVRELITLISPNTDAAGIARLLVPPVGTVEVKKSLKIMLELGLVKKDRDGNYVQSDRFISAGGPVRNMAIVNFQKAMIMLAARAWDYFPEKEVHMNTLTVTMSDDLVETIHEEIAAFKRRILSLVSNENKKAVRAYDININFFPVSKRIKEEAI